MQELSSIKLPEKCRPPAESLSLLLNNPAGPRATRGFSPDLPDLAFHRQARFSSIPALFRDVGQHDAGSAADLGLSGWKADPGMATVRQTARMGDCATLPGAYGGAIASRCEAIGHWPVHLRNAVILPHNPMQSESMTGAAADRSDF